MTTRSTLWTLLLVLSLSACHKQAGRKLGTDPRQRESYSVGYKLGASLQRQKASIDVDAYVLGLREALAGTASQVSEEEIRTAVTRLRDQAMAAQTMDDKAKAAVNRAAGQAFLDTNGKRDGVRILPSGLQYKVMKEGSGRNPGAGDVVVVNYKGTLVDGTEFANTYKRRKAAVATLDQVIPGWKEALTLMKESSKWQLVVPPALAYGQRGAPGIGPESTLVFEVELLGFRPTGTSGSSSERPSPPTAAVASSAGH